MLSDLNPEQKAAVEEEGNVLVSACPGSGKTRVLTKKVAYELDKLGSSKKFVVALTYTNRAADEIQRRLDQYDLKTEKLWAGTIHSFCLDWIVRPFASYHQRLKNGFTVADEYTCAEILDMYKEQLGIRGYEDVVTKHNRTGVYVNSSDFTRHAADLYHQYLSDHKLIDFDLILFIAYELMRDIPTIAMRLANIISVISVDEYQDMQDMQYAIIGQIMRAGNGEVRLFVVGDADQAIYDSLGGQAKTVDDIEEEIGFQMTPLALSGNYRSSSRIIRLYRNFQMSDIEVVARGQRANEQGIVTFNDQINKDQLDLEIARLVRSSLDQGIMENEICVLAPQWWLITSMGRRLKQLLPDVNFDAPGISPLHRHSTNFWFKVARLFLTEPSPKLYNTRIRWANEVLRELENQYSITVASEYRSGRSLLRLINSIRPNHEDGIDYLETAFTILQQKLGLNFNEDSVLAEQQTNLLQRAREVGNREGYVPTDIQSLKNLFKESKGVVISTCQGVKGEEYETVIAFGILRNYIPHWKVIDRNDPTVEVPSSKRLLYVICSRAKTNLHLISERGRTSSTRRPLEINRQLAHVRFDFDDIEVLDF